MIGSKRKFYMGTPTDINKGPREMDRFKTNCPK